MLTFRNYLTGSISRACTSGLPAINQTEKDIELFLPRNHTFGDVASSVALRISAVTGTSPGAVAQTILNNFEWNQDFVETPFELRMAVDSGFLNFRFSDRYLTDTLGNTDSTGSYDSAEGTDHAGLTAGSYDFSSVMERMLPILRHARRSGFSSIPNRPDIIQNMRHSSERRLLRELSKSRALERNMAMRIADAYLVFYLECPVFTMEQETTAARILLTLATYRALGKSGMIGPEKM